MQKPSERNTVAVIATFGNRVRFLTQIADLSLLTYVCTEEKKKKMHNIIVLYTHSEEGWTPHSRMYVNVGIHTIVCIYGSCAIGLGRNLS